MKADVFDQQNNKVEEVELSDRVFAVRWNSDLVHQVLVAQLANRRRTLAHAKGRGEVRGGGKKPWRQKGTGRARHGSIRSPLWPGGGVTFGPTKERVFAKKINKKMRQKAVAAVLSKKIKEGELKVLDSFNLPSAATKNLMKIIAAFGKKPSVLLVDAGKKNVFLSSRNLKGVGSVGVNSLNLYDLLRFKNIFMEKEAALKLSAAKI